MVDSRLETNINNVETEYLPKLLYAEAVAPYGFSPVDKSKIDRIDTLTPSNSTGLEVSLVMPVYRCAACGREAVVAENCCGQTMVVVGPP
jgi:hypothetical protein